MDARDDELPPASEAQLAVWRAEQARIASLVITHDVFEWKFDDNSPLFVAGTDISFSTTCARTAVATIAVVMLHGSEMRTVFSMSHHVNVTTPYASSYLAFREAPIVEDLFRAIPECVRTRTHALLVDGNGVLHVRGAGLACQLGIALDIPTVGVSKTLYCMDGLDERVVRDAVASAGEAELEGDSGRVWGRAILTGNATAKPIFVSVGHRISSDSAVRLVRVFCKYRVPEPIRIADLHSREALRTGRLVEVWDEFIFGKKQNS